MLGLRFLQPTLQAVHAVIQAIKPAADPPETLINRLQTLINLLKSGPLAEFPGRAFFLREAGSQVGCSRWFRRCRRLSGPASQRTATLSTG